LRELVKRVVGVLLGYVIEVIGFGRAVSCVVVSVSGTIEGRRSRLMQHI